MIKYLQNHRILFHVLITALILIAFVAIYVSGVPKDAPKPVGGVLDLSGWDMEQGRQSLAGEWEFYWQELCDYDELHGKQVPQRQLVTVPNTWNTYRVGGEKLPGYGYATYRLRVKVKGGVHPIYLRVDTMSTAYRLYVNDRELASNGTVGRGKDNAKPGYCPEVIGFDPPAGEFDIILQISNYTYARGGFWYDITLGTQEQIEGLNRMILYKDAILIGSLLIMALYYASFYIVLQREKSSLYFMLLCLIFILRTSLYGDMLIVRLFPQLSFRLLIYLTYATLYWIPVAIYLMVDSLYVCRKAPFLKQALVLYAAAASLVTAVLPIHIYTSWIMGIEVIGIAIVVLSVYVVICAYSRKEKGAGIILASVVLILVTGVHDVLYQANRIQHPLGELASMGIFLFMFTFSFIIASRLSDAYEQEKSLAEQLNESLQKEKIASRELVKTELSFLQAQIKPHFLFNSLSVIAALNTQNPQKAKELLYDLSDYLRGSFNFENYDGVTPLSSELSTVRAYLSIEQARFGEKLQVIYEIDPSIDILIPMLVIQPLVENAIRHGIRKKLEGGTLRLTIQQEQEGVVITVEDNGAGIRPERLNELLQEKGKRPGVGLINIHRRLNAYYGQGLMIDSILGKGTTVTFHIPEKEVNQHA